MKRSRSTDSDYSDCESSSNAPKKEKKSRMRPHLSCEPCRARKSKCDRLSFCSSCKLHGTSCYWMGAEPTALSEDSEVDSLRAECNRLRLLVQMLSAQLGVGDMSGAVAQQPPPMHKHRTYDPPSPAASHHGSPAEHQLASGPPTTDAPPPPSLHRPSSALLHPVVSPTADFPSFATLLSTSEPTEKHVDASSYHYYTSVDQPPSGYASDIVSFDFASGSFGAPSSYPMEREQMALNPLQFDVVAPWPGQRWM